MHVYEKKEDKSVLALFLHTKYLVMPRHQYMTDANYIHTYTIL